MKVEEKYPKDFQEFLTQFSNENACWDYLIEIRWPEGYVCSQCKSIKYWLTAKHKIHCSNCGKEFSITSGTIFQDSKKPILLWFHIMWWIVAQKTGASANNLKDFMGFGSYETAWLWLHKLRRAMVREGREKLSGAEEKILVAVASECIGKQIGRVRFKIIPDASKEILLTFINENVEYGSTIITDGWSGYASLTQNKEYKHIEKVISGSGKQAHELLPHVHMVNSLVKRWINGTHQGKISPKHMEYYLDEFAFRFNRKLSTHRGKLFYRLMQQAVTNLPMTYNDITK
jgi:transposase-like protein/DNA-directed RNA polymerase subunit RPC12/RpoP